MSYHVEDRISVSQLTWSFGVEQTRVTAS